jgi:hypothetical protein
MVNVLRRYSQADCLYQKKFASFWPTISSHYLPFLEAHRMTKEVKASSKYPKQFCPDGKPVLSKSFFVFDAARTILLGRQ